MKRALSILALASLAACGGGSMEPIEATVTFDVKTPTGTPTVPTTPTGPVCTVELNGDSIMWGQSVPYGTVAGPILRHVQYPALTLKALRPKYTVDDRSVGGQTATARAPLFNTETHTSRFIVFEHGINDYLQGFNPAGPLNSMISTAIQQKKLVIVTGLNQMSLPNWGIWANAIKSIAVNNGVTYAQWSLVPLPGIAATDGIHPDQADSIALVQRLVDTLDSLAPECK